MVTKRITISSEFKTFLSMAIRSRRSIWILGILVSSWGAHCERLASGGLLGEVDEGVALFILLNVFTTGFRFSEMPLTMPSTFSLIDVVMFWTDEIIGVNMESAWHQTNRMFICNLEQTLDAKKKGFEVGVGVWEAPETGNQILNVHVIYSDGF